jgi:tetratricopeptide (TPR) repeat protein
MGRVYEAALVGPGGFRKQVAVKVLVGGGAGLVREARMGGLLRHANLVEVYDVGEADGTWYCAMELVPRRLPEHLPTSAVIDVGLHVCAGLQYAHETLGLVHLDLKPGNLLVDDLGVVKVADLGIAKARGFELDGISGTPGFMSPEQAAGGLVDARSDIYSLGLVLRDLDRDAHASLHEVISRCLAADPAQRFPSMDALAEALDALAVGGPGLAEAMATEALAHTTATFTLIEEDPSTNLEGEDHDLVGRQAELLELTAALEAPGLAVVTGAPGVGKSHLARDAARAWHTATGGQVWVCDATGVSDRGQLEARVAHTLGIPLEDSAQLEAALRARGPLVLVLDGADRLADTSAVKAWLAAVPMLRVVVTRRARWGAGDSIRVRPLPETAAAQLLANRTGLDVDDLRALAAELDGLPHALVLASARLDRMTPAQLVARMGSRLKLLGGRSDALRASLEESWELLGPHAKNALSQCAVLRGRFEPEAAEAIVALPPDAPWVLDVLDELVDCSLILGIDGHLWLPESIRAFATEKLGDDEGPAARHAAWFAQHGAPGLRDRLDAPGGTSLWHRLVADLDNVLEAARWALDHDDPIAVPAVLAAGTVLVRRGPPGLAVDLVRGALSLAPPTHELRLLSAAALQAADPIAAAAELDAGLSEAHHAAARFELHLARTSLCLVQAQTAGAGQHLDAARRIKPPTAKARARLEVLAGALRLELGDHIGAQLQLESALEVLEPMGAQRSIASAVRKLAIVHRKLGRADLARSSYEQLCGLYRALGERDGEGHTLANLAVALDELNDLDGAEQCFHLALRRLRTVGGRRLEGIALGNYGDLLARLGRVDEARTAFEASLALHDAVGNRRHRAVVYAFLGRTERRAGRPGIAMEHYLASLEDFRVLGYTVDEADTLANLGNLHTEQGRIPEAMACYTKALPIYRDTKKMLSMGVVLASMGGALSTTDDLAGAQAACERAIEVFSELGNQVWEGIALGYLSGALQRDGRHDDAREALVRAVALLQGRHRLAAATFGRDLAEIDGDLTALREHAATTRELGAKAEYILCECALARVHMGRGEVDEARAAVVRAEYTAADTNDAGAAAWRTVLTATRRAVLDLQG